LGSRLQVAGRFAKAAERLIKHAQAVMGFGMVRLAGQNLAVVLLGGWDVVVRPGQLG
jgi:hypothetical protein